MTQVEILHILQIVLDFIFVYCAVYYLLRWTVEMRIFSIVKGLFFITALYGLAILIKLPSFLWILKSVFVPIVIVIVILFQYEIRRFLDRLGRLERLFSFTPTSEGQKEFVIQELLKTIQFLSFERIGALIVIEQDTHLGEYIDTGVSIDGSISKDLLTTLFWPGTPTHDGAVIIRDNRIVSAGCLLPLTETPLVDRRLGTRHRAALGLSEVTDAVVFVVSEEQGAVSIAEYGKLFRYQTRDTLYNRLLNLYSERHFQSSLYSDIDKSVFGKAT